MIEPLRFKNERAPVYIVLNPVNCLRCLSKSNNRGYNNVPNLAVKYCSQCPQKHQFTCRECDTYLHSYSHTCAHVRRILVIGPGVRKRVVVRGDARSFPQPLDVVEINFRTKIYHNGQLLGSQSLTHLRFQTGLSGRTMHLQVLGCRGLPVADAHGSSDPFVNVSYSGVKLGSTRTRHRTLNPHWTNETFILPMEDSLPAIRGVPRAQRDVLKIEVYDYDYFNLKDFLGQVEITKARLLKLSQGYGEQPIRLNLTSREFHGMLGIRLAVKGSSVYVRIDKAEGLDKMDPQSLSSPFCRVYLGDKSAGRTQVVNGTVNPAWTRSNTFRFSIIDVIERESYLRGKTAQKGREARSKDIIIFRIEVYSANKCFPSTHLGTVRVPIDTLRRVLPQLPTVPPQKIGWYRQLVEDLRQTLFGVAASSSAKLQDSASASGRESDALLHGRSDTGTADDGRGGGGLRASSKEISGKRSSSRQPLAMQHSLRSRKSSAAQQSMLSLELPPTQHSGVMMSSPELRGGEAGGEEEDVEEDERFSMWGRRSGERDDGTVDILPGAQREDSLSSSDDSFGGSHDEDEDDRARSAPWESLEVQ